MEKSKFNLGDRVNVSDSYHIYENTFGVVTAIDTESRGWYDDHQDGGWTSKGMITVKLDNGDFFNEPIEYANDYWTKE